MIEQLAIALTGVIAVALTQSTNKNYQKYACWFGIVGQPFWFYTTYQAEQWGIFLLCFFYTAAWLKGAWSFWIAPKVFAKENG